MMLSLLFGPLIVAKKPSLAQPEASARVPPAARLGVELAAEVTLASGG